MSTMNGTATETPVQEEDVSAEIQKTLENFGQELRDKADDVRVGVVQQLTNVAETMRREIEQNEQVDGTTKEYADKFIDGIEKTADYLDQQDVGILGDKAFKTVKNNPVKTLSIIFVIGLIIGILLNRND